MIKETKVTLDNIQIKPSNVVEPKTMIRIEVKAVEHVFYDEELYCGELICGLQQV